MFHKKLKRAGAFILAASLAFSAVQFPAVQTKAADSENAARNATATALNEEASTTPANKVNDGDTTSRESRWSSKISGDPTWIQLHWDQPQTMKNIVIYWERRNVQNYQLEVSNDGQSWGEPVWSNSDYPARNKETITLDTPVTASYLRLYIGTVNRDSVDSSETAWQTAAIYEIEVYEDEIPDSRTEAQKIADEISAPATVKKGDTKISMPNELPAGTQVRFCADYEQVIGEDGTIYAPLEDKQVKGFYEITLADETSAKTEEFTITVPGQYAPETDTNEKPAVIPELQEWHGKTGSFLVDSSSRIIVKEEELLDTAAIFAEDYEKITGMPIKVISGTEEDAILGDFYFAFSESANGLGKEGYTIDVSHIVKIESEETTGAYWATRTILQILKQSKGILPKGLIRDYPKYEVRAFSFDVGRKPFTLDAVNEFAENMSWYKMNSLQMHLSDNLIFLEDYPNEETAIEQAYAGFRLESTKKSKVTGKTATSEDVFYSKNDFRTFVKDSRARGVEIVPEFDMPAHALPFTRAFSEIMSTGVRTGRYRIDELDLTQMVTPASPGGESVMDIVKGIWNEYFEGDDPVFDKDTTIHIGTDEYHGVSGQIGIEYFRSFSDRMIEFVQSTGRTVRMWGSLSNKTGETPVRSEGVQLNIWNTGYADPKAMYDLGFDLINTLEGQNYLVPAAGYYNDYINAQGVYNNWKPNVINNLTMSAGDDQMLGGCYAIWHDSVDTRANGISQYDSFDRFFKAVPAYGAKLWGDAEDRNYAEFTKVAEETGTAPGTTIYGELDYATSTVVDYTFDDTLEKDSSANGFDLQDLENAEQVNGSEAGKKALYLKGGKSYIETPEMLDLIGSDAVLTMKVKRDVDSGDDEQILCESKEEFGIYGTYAFKAVQKNTGKVGFSREGYDYSFNYELPKDDTWHVLEFHSGQETVSLYVDGELIDNKHYNADGSLATTTKGDNTVVISSNNNPDIYFDNHATTELSEKLTKEGIRKIATMLVPLGRIGSKTNSFKGQIEYLTVGSVKETSGEYGSLSKIGWQGAACSTASGEGSIEAVFDGDKNTYWHQNYSSDVKDETQDKDTVHPATKDHWFEITLSEAKEISKLTYLPRQDSTNGRIYEYSIEVTTPEGQIVNSVSHQSWADNNSLKTAVFEPVEAQKVKLVIHDAKGGHATIAELNLYETSDADELRNSLRDVLTRVEELDENDYTEISWKDLLKAKKEAELLMNAEGSVDTEDYIYAIEQIQNAEANLEEIDSATKKKYQAAAQLKDLTEQLKSEFTSSSSTEWIQSIEQVKALLAKENANADEISSGLQEIEKTKDDMTKTSSAKKTELTNAVTTAETKLKNTAGFTKASVEALQKAVAAAKAVLQKEKPGFDEMNNALKLLTSTTLVAETDKGLKDNDTFEAGGIKYQVISAASQTVKLVKGKDTAKITIDTVTYNNKQYKVTEISTKAFSGCKKKLKKVTIGANVEVIGKNAFKGCKKLKTVTVKNNSKLKSVGSGAFKKTAKNISIKLPKNLKKNKNLKKQIQKAGIKKIK